MLAGIDLGGTQVRVALARSDGRLTSSFKTKTPLLGTPQRMVEWAASEIERNRGRDKLTAITIAAPGPNDGVRGIPPRSCSRPPPAAIARRGRSWSARRATWDLP